MSGRGHVLGRALQLISLIGITALILGGMASCTMLGFNYASLETGNKAAPQPPLRTNLDRAGIKATLATDLYGPWPTGLPAAISQPIILNDEYLSGQARLEEVRVTIGTGPTARSFPVILVLPEYAKDRPVPLIISQTFLDNCAVLPDQPVTGADGETCDGSPLHGAVGFFATTIFGPYIAEAPLETYIQAGFGYASFYGPGFVPDRNDAAQDTMAAMRGSSGLSSALMAWAYAYAAVAEQFGRDPRIDANAITALGHSRYGKSALIAAAWSDSIAAAIAHQSGFAGAASSQSDTGETLLRMTATYPHWLRPGLADELRTGWRPAFDQHYLLALAAPKPVLLGNGRRDVWSDPNSSFRIARAASPAYDALRVNGLLAQNMLDFRPADRLSYWLRPGGHSIVAKDIDAFIAFLTAHFHPRHVSEIENRPILPEK